MFKQETVGESFWGASAKSQDKLRLAEGAGEGGGFQTAKMRLAVALEEFGDGEAGAGFEVGVEVEKGPAEVSGKEMAHRRFSRSHKSGKNDAADTDQELGCGLEIGFAAGFK